MAYVIFKLVLGQRSAPHDATKNTGFEKELHFEFRSETILAYFSIGSIHPVSVSKRWMSANDSKKMQHAPPDRHGSLTSRAQARVFLKHF